MRLSEAIRLGAMQTRPAKGRVVVIDDDGKVCASCAFGAATVAVGLGQPGHFGAIEFGEMGRIFPLLNTKPVSPVPGRLGGWDLGDMMSALYESHGWTREQVADWVEGIERAHEQPLAVSEVLRPVSIPTAASSAL